MVDILLGASFLVSILVSNALCIAERMSSLGSFRGCRMGREAMLFLVPSFLPSFLPHETT